MRPVLVAVTAACFTATLQAADVLLKKLDTKELDAYVEQNLQQRQVPGLAIAIVKDGKVDYARGYGTRIAGENAPVDEHTLFSIGSNSKYFTANALAILVGEGKLKWDDRLIDLVPEFQSGSDIATTHTTVIDALSHRTGMRGTMTGWHNYPSRNRRDLVRLMKYAEPIADFRHNWNYNNLMFLAAGEVIPELTGMSWDDFVEQRLFKPLGMDNSFTSVTALAQQNNVAEPHELDNGKLIRIPHKNIDNVAAAGSIVSSVTDMARWLNFQLNNGKVAGESIVPEKELAVTRKAWSLAPGEYTEHMGLSKNFSAYGLGIQITDLPGGYKMFTHSGGIDGMTSNTAFIPELDLGVVVLTNSSSSISLALSGWILDRYIGLRDVDWVDIAAEKAKEREQEAHQKVAKFLDKIGTGKPPISLESYQGVYSHGLEGEFSVVEKDGVLTFTLGETMAGRLQHSEVNTFVTRIEKPLFRKKLFTVPVHFTLDADGKPVSLSFFGYTFVRKDK